MWPQPAPPSGAQLPIQPPLEAAGDDEVTAYARAVVDGAIVAGPLVRAACRRHLQDLAHGADRGLSFDVAAAERAIGFFRDILTVEVEEKDEFGEVSTFAAPFDLQAWQAFIIGSLFGWRNALGFRRFRRAYVEIGKGNGKSPLAAGIGHYMLLGCRKLRAEVYSAATDKDQAAILFRDAVAMWERSPALRRRLKPKGANPVWELHTSRPGVNSFFKPISSDKKGKSGIRPYCALIDEVHEHPDNSVIEMMRAGTKGNQEALLFEITNSGFDKKTVCGQEHDLSARIVNGEFDNDAWFAYVACLDEADDPFEDESCWIKANPNLGVSIQPPFIREQVQEARGMPSKEGLVRRLHFCQWTESENSAIPRATWAACEGEVDPDKLTEAGYPCFGGLDLSKTRDLTAFTLTWVLDATKDQEKFASKTWFWTPKDTLKERAKSDRAPYDVWVDQGHLEAVPGKRIKYSWLAAALLALNARYHPVMICADQYGLEQLNEALGAINESLPTEVHPQGFQRRIVGERAEEAQKETGAEDIVLWMPDSINKLEAALLEQRITIAPSPVMRMCAGGVVYEQNRSGHRMFDKSKATTRIDGMVSQAMSIGGATTTKAKPEASLVLL
ncbi:terminase large subunit [Bradyrhizobium sp. AUGA SZCCT0051]|nr:terminase large subunit [Bradyrhizobium sp. AUGA SZCCT0124]MBR1313510.1 terminase large subunit [Bradyrhizobium sp. AUGA SZCCT0051]MBR1343393.1 terminase large subunit [Bradyrhizobium sp. AUGA SZCCT0105]MBR1357187.1 terminase large subunit [Bradyrhizobium sp. AUGA SZCCT0045]